MHQCIPKVEFPDDWDVTFSANHWSNEGTMTDYIHWKNFAAICGRKAAGAVVGKLLPCVGDI